MNGSKMTDISTRLEYIEQAQGCLPPNKVRVNSLDTSAV